MNKKVGVLGGTFDPVHIGHLAIARSFLDSGWVDELWIIPAGEPPHKNGDEITPFADRMNMLRSAFEDWEKVVVSPIEETLPRPSYTLRTIRALKQHYPDDRFYLCMGSDSLASFTRWHRYKEILEECSLLAARRPGYRAEDIDPELKGKVRLVNHHPLKVSSGRLREKMANGYLPVDQIPERVCDYIKRKGLYGQFSA